MEEGLIDLGKEPRVRKHLRDVYQKHAFVDDKANPGGLGMEMTHLMNMTECTLFETNEYQNT